jgi:hypothetical protein
VTRCRETQRSLHPGVPFGTLGGEAGPRGGCRRDRRERLDGLGRSGEIGFSDPAGPIVIGNDDTGRTMTITDPIRERLVVRDTVDEALASAVPADRREALAQLIVLTDHGDEVAARQLREWVAVDPTAEAMWMTIVRDVDAVRAG